MGTNKLLVSGLYILSGFKHFLPNNIDHVALIIHQVRHIPVQSINSMHVLFGLDQLFFTVHKDIVFHCIINVQFLLLGNLRRISIRTNLLIFLLAISSICRQTSSSIHWVSHFCSYYWFLHQSLTDLFEATTLLFILFFSFPQPVSMLWLFWYLLHFFYNIFSLLYLFIHNALLI